MAQINLQGLVNNIPEKTTVYTPIVEAIVNSIQAIEASKRNDGIVTVVFQRDAQQTFNLENDSLAPINSIEVHDNGIGFDNANRDSFDTLYSDQKLVIGGKGFGRFMFLKYFEKAEIDSIYKDSNKYYERSFTFSVKAKSVQNLIEDEKIIEYRAKDLKTVIVLSNLKDKFKSRFDKKLETIARNLVEKLLPYFIDKNYKCPQIIIEDASGGDRIVLNNFFNDYDEIKQVSEKKFKLEKGDNTEEFEIKIFKIYFTQSPSAVILSAHNRAVTTEVLYDYIPEFKDDFYDVVASKEGVVNKNYSIKAYILGSYLNQHVSLERNDFAFSKDGDLLYPFCRKEIEVQATNIVKDEFSEEVVGRQQKKLQRIKEYVDNQAPWHKSYSDELDLSTIPYHFDEVTLEGELQKVKFNKEQSVKAKVVTILEDEQGEMSEKIAEISKDLTELGKVDLAHYVISRKVILDILNRSIKWNKNKQYEKEKVVHNLIFPMNSDSDHLSYNQHNLWILDERLSFHEYLASDKALNTDDERPDLLIFSKSIAVREGVDLSNPITVIEFKRPQRENYDDNEDPIVQICQYIEKIRKGNFKDIDGRNIKANENTPAYGFLVCDISDKIKEFCKRHSLTPSPDLEGYFGFHNGYKVYVEVISFDKLVRDAEIRNRIFFKALKLE